MLVVAAPHLQSMDSEIVAHQLSCSETCGLFLDKGSNLLSPTLAGGFLSTVPPEKSWCGPLLMSLLNLLQYCFCFMFCSFSYGACGILASHQGQTSLSALEGGSLNRWTTRKVPRIFSWSFLSHYSHHWSLGEAFQKHISSLSASASHFHLPPIKTVLPFLPII